MLSQVRIAEAAAVLIVLLSTFAGYYNGLIKTLFHLVRFILVIVLSIALTPVIAGFVPQTSLAGGGIAYTVSFVISMIAIGIIGHILGVVERIPVLKELNRMAGAAAGLAMGVILLWIVLIVIGAAGSVEWCAFVMSLVQKSSLLTLLHDMNPIAEVINRISGFPVPGNF